jgi:ABC-type Mn2+/Zn2+ transport system permease subunit
MADAMAHSLLPGVAVALLLFGLMPGTLFVGALLAALLVAFGTQIISNSSRIKEDTALGLLFACSFSLGLVLISLSSVRVNVSDYLFGNILARPNGASNLKLVWDVLLPHWEIADCGIDRLAAFISNQSRSETHGPSLTH